MTCEFLLQRLQSILSELNTFLPDKRLYLSYCYSDSGLNGTVLYQTYILNGGSLEITSTVPLNLDKIIISQSILKEVNTKQADIL